MAEWYVGSVQWTAVTAWAALTAYSSGDIRRQLATPTVGNERVWRVTTPGTSGAAEPSWTLTKGSTTNDGTVVWTEITGNSTYGWTAAHARSENAVSWGAAGDTYYTADDHTQTVASAFTLTLKGTAAAPDRVICVNPAGSAPPVDADLSSGFSWETTGANNITVAGRGYIYGAAPKAGSGAVNASITVSNGVVIWDNSALELRATGGSGRILVANGADLQGELRNTTISFSNASQGIAPQAGSFRWVNRPGSAAVLGTAPTNLVLISSGQEAYLEGLDLDAMGSGKTIFQAGTTSGRFRAVACKLNASVTPAGTPTSANTYVDFTNCNSTSNVQNNLRYGYMGTLTTETTIVRTAGASDGTTPYSWKIVPNSNNNFDFPFITREGEIWNDTTGSSMTLTVHCVTDNVTLTDAEIWLEVEYPGSSATPVVSLVSDAPATVLTTPANQASDSGEAWTTTGLTTPVKQKLECTFTPQLKGPIVWRVKYAKTSTTVYVCPKADLA